MFSEVIISRNCAYSAGHGGEAVSRKRQSLRRVRHGSWGSVSSGGGGRECGSEGGREVVRRRAAVPASRAGP